jgi:hypothetical protein
MLSTNSEKNNIKQLYFTHTVIGTFTHLVTVCCFMTSCKHFMLVYDTIKHFIFLYFFPVLFLTATFEISVSYFSSTLHYKTFHFPVRFSLSFHYSIYFLLYFPCLFTIQLRFLPYFSYIFTIQLALLPYCPYLITIRLAFLPYLFTIQLAFLPYCPYHFTIRPIFHFRPRIYFYYLYKACYSF